MLTCYHHQVPVLLHLLLLLRNPGLPLLLLQGVSRITFRAKDENRSAVAARGQQSRQYIKVLSLQRVCVKIP